MHLIMAFKSSLISPFSLTSEHNSIYLINIEYFGPQGILTNGLQGYGVALKSST
jgi:hypothetical protein